MASHRTGLRTYKTYYYAWIYRHSKDSCLYATPYYIDRGGVEHEARFDKLALVVKDRHMNYTFRRLVKRMEKLHPKARLLYWHWIWLDAPPVIIWTWLPREQVFEIIAQ